MRNQDGKTESGILSIDESLGGLWPTVKSFDVQRVGYGDTAGHTYRGYCRGVGRGNYPSHLGDL